MKKNKFVLVLFLLSAVVANTSCSKQKNTGHKFASYADTLLDRTFKHYGVENTCLFNENYPKQEEDMVTYLAGQDVMRKDKVAYLWPTSGLFSGVNALLRTTGDEKYKTILEERLLPGLDCYYDTLRAPHCYQSYLAEDGFSDRFYDDNIWLGIDFLESFHLTGNSAYLSTSQAIWTFIESGRDEVLGDGIYWCEQQKNSKNTCSNAPAAVWALQLYQATGEEEYLQAGKELYHWTKANLQDSIDYLYLDNIRLDGSIDNRKYSYNSGQMLQAAALLHKITGENIYLSDARMVAKACSERFFQEYKDGDVRFRAIANGNIWFVAVMLRGFEELYGIDHEPCYLNDFKMTLERMWNTCRDENGLFEDDCFLKPLEKVKGHKWLLTQAAMIEMYARLSKYQL